ncbi:translation initiation factor IF-2 [Trichococcus ilyis]|jgi:translation initiation factor IF-2|uniref:Translation initiation factor IF-2 n=1 Tax=Trichococcus ilyis TaxID=640938 RepID=A0A143Y5W2_9LACT|nr:translation initiation factor IF-2 [Trichococcus ilyis]CZQ80174.1 initiation factor 2 signature [Trichococcus ilyis]SEI57126.1 translation initiation factor IF-2 [Trichococcus ilyis]
MEKKRVYEYAKEHKVSSKTVLDKAKQLGIDYHSHMSTMEDGDIKKLNQAIASGNQDAAPSAPQANAPQKKRPAESKKAPAAGTHKPTDKSEPRKNKDMKEKPSQPSQNQKTGSGNRGQARSTSERNTKRPAQTASQAGQERPNTKMNRVDSVSPNKSNDKPVQKTANTNTNAPAKSNRPSYGQNSGGSNQRGQGNQGRGNNPYNKNKRSKFKKGTTKQGPAVPPRKFRELPETFIYTDGMTVMEVAKKLHREPAEIIKKLFLMGIMVTQNQALGKDALELLAADYGIEAEEKFVQDISDLDSYFEMEENPDELVSRPPVVTIMGHVDHGKTTLLDSLRNTNVIQTEAGGITQHIGAYQVKIDGKPITFLDTPGHAAFTTMRARGADVTDITIIVVAADDGVMPQTIEAINHAKAADVPIIVAVNKIDKPTANPDRVMQELSDQGLIPEAWGGDTIFVNISAKFGQGIDELLEMILLVAEVQELKANPNRLAIGSVIEARLDKSKGPIATVLVQAGTLKVGDPLVAGNTHGRVRVMVNDQGRRVKTAGPAMPVEITGLNAAPQAGDHFVVFEDEKTARQAGEERAKRALVEQRSSQNRVTLDNLFSSLKDGELKEVNVIIKADVQGSVEALAASLQKIEVEGVRVKIVHSAAGAINESDVTLAAASNAIIIGFNVRPTPQAKIQAEGESVDIRLHRIIYNAIDEIETAMKGMLDPEFEEQVTGQALIRETYKVSKVGTIGGAFVTDGYIGRNSSVRIIRDNIVIFDGKLASLKRFKDDAKEVKKGFECGLMIEDYNDIRIDDVIEAYHMVEIKK